MAGKPFDTAVNREAFLEHVDANLVDADPRVLDGVAIVAENMKYYYPDNEVTYSATVPIERAIAEEANLAANELADKYGYTGQERTDFIDAMGEHIIAQYSELTINYELNPWDIAVLCDQVEQVGNSSALVAVVESARIGRESGIGGIENANEVGASHVGQAQSAGQGLAH